LGRINVRVPVIAVAVFLGETIPIDVLSLADRVLPITVIVDPITTKALTRLHLPWVDAPIGVIAVRALGTVCPITVTVRVHTAREGHATIEVTAHTHGTV
jgi:hypothetical protein